MNDEEKVQCKKCLKFFILIESGDFGQGVDNEKQSISCPYCSTPYAEIRTRGYFRIKECKNETN